MADAAADEENTETVDPEVSIANKTRDQMFLEIWRQIDRKLTDQNRLTRDMLGALHDVRDQGHVERDTLLTLKDVQQELKIMRENGNPGRAILNAVIESREVNAEIRDELRALREFLQIAMSNNHAD